MLLLHHKHVSGPTSSHAAHSKPQTKLLVGNGVTLDMQHTAAAVIGSEWLTLSSLSKAL